ncbi:MAG: DHH family phosphoesterase [Phycisphaeraceae bacterium]|nr:MAG: DHH family phosphoesterase [Phycisphaeraceae bacterium]
MSEWTSNTTLDEINRWLAPKKSVVVITHSKPDGDALGSTLAVARALNIAAGGSAAGFSGVASRAEVWFTGPMPGWWRSIAQDTKTRIIDQHNPPPASHDPDAVLVLDTGAWSQLADYRPWLDDQHARCILIDHHLNGDGDVAHKRLVDTSAAAACEIVAGLCTRLLKVESPSKLPVEITEPLYLGLATDTGWFRHSNVSPSVYRLAADLVETGVGHERLFELVEQRERAGRLRLLARALNTLELHDDGRVAVLSLTQSDFEKAGAAPGESGGFLDLVKTVESVRVAVLLTEVETAGDGVVTKISFRSKGGPDMIDVNKVSMALGGGGHAQAAGARLVGTRIGEARTKVLEALGVSA